MPHYCIISFYDRRVQNGVCFYAAPPTQRSGRASFRRRGRLNADPGVLDVGHVRDPGEIVSGVLIFPSPKTRGKCARGIYRTAVIRTTITTTTCFLSRNFEINFARFRSRVRRLRFRVAFAVPNTVTVFPERMERVRFSVTTAREHVSGSHVSRGAVTPVTLVRTRIYYRGGARGEGRGGGRKTNFRREIRRATRHRPVPPPRAPRGANTRVGHTRYLRITGASLLQSLLFRVARIYYYNRVTFRRRNLRTDVCTRAHFDPGII